MENNLKFNSSICTSLEQSKRLLELGLKKETADMVYHYQKSRTEAMQWELRPHPPTLRSNCHFNIERLNVLKQKNSDGVVMSGEEYFDFLWGKDIPAWSLHRLIELLGGNIAIDDFAIEWAYDTVIDHIAFDIRHDQFNHEYLEEKK